MENRPLVVSLFVGALFLAAILTVAIVGRDDGDSPNVFRFTGPSPEARATHDALVSVGGSPSFDCSTYLAGLGDDLEEQQKNRLCIGSEAKLAGPISECICGSAAVETQGPEDSLVLTALEDLGFGQEEKMVAGVGNVTMRTGMFNATMCRMRLGSGADVDALQNNICSKTGKPRYSSRTAECVCLDMPVSPPGMCTPGASVPVIANGTQVGDLSISQSNSSVVLNFTSPGYCQGHPSVYIGATRSNRDHLTPMVPLPASPNTWELEINIVGGEDAPVQFSYQFGFGTLFPPEWNHPNAPTFHCGDDIYVDFKTHVREQVSGVCSGEMIETDVVLPVYPFCCI